jgi:hypothetical protein
MPDHNHPHDHDRGHGHEHYADHPHHQHVVLDIGDGVGALIVHTDPSLIGNEVEISPAGDDSSRSHKEVLERVIDGRSTYVLVFDNLAEGEHTLWQNDVARARNVRIASGEIAELDWRSTR